MQKRLIELHQQRGRLQERIAHQRATLRQQLTPVQGVLAVPQRILNVQQEGMALLRKHPLIAVGVVMTLVVLRPRTLLRWAGRALGAWRTWRTVSGMVPGFLWNQLRQ
ncbi:MAG: YqjK family protein [Burkholderiaceae bacterium]